MFSISDSPLNRDELVQSLANDKAGAIVVFEGWVRNHNEGKPVKSLEYQVYRELALKEGEKILQEAKIKFNLHDARCVHREGHLYLSDIAIWIGATASHRDDAFKASRYIIDEVKHRLPVWKKEHYASGNAEWVFCKHHHHHVHFTENDYYQKQEGLLNQTKLKNSKVLVVGAGGLGCPVLVNLASAGVGHITIVDPDNISVSNIHRQTLYSPNLVGEKKAIVASNRIKELNPFVHVNAVIDWVNENHLDHDLVMDCTDSLETKYFLHDICLKKRIPLITASIFKNEGVLRTISPGEGCLRCLNTHTPDDSFLGNCNDFGVIGVTTSLLGSYQAKEAITFLSEGKNLSTLETFYFNFADFSVSRIKNSAKTDCSYCKGDIHIETNDLEVTEAEHILDIRNLTDEEVLSQNLDGVALCCHKGVRSKKLALKLRERGEIAFSLKGGACSL